MARWNELEGKHFYHDCTADSYIHVPQKKNPIGRLVGGDEILLSQKFSIIQLWHTELKCASQFHFQEANNHDECWI